MIAAKTVRPQEKMADHDRGIAYDKTRRAHYLRMIGAARQDWRNAMMRPLAAALAACFIAALAAPASAETRPVVVELFTSQGCSSCPPADALLGELARRADIVALGYHISYWDDLGWKDPFSSQAATARQRVYAGRFNAGQVFTPEMVVEGTKDMIGSDRAAVRAAIEAARPQAAAPVHLAGDRGSVAIGAGSGRGTVLLVRFVRHRTTPVGAGENAHRVADDTNAVETLAQLGEWHGVSTEFAFAAPAPGEGVAVLVQGADGAILGAATVLAVEPAAKI
jgi:hypothetical protein